MFSPRFFFRNNFSLKKVFPLFFTLCLGAALFSSCDWNGGDGEGGAGIIGNWADPQAGDRYEITNTTIKYVSGYPAMDFNGTITSTENFDNSSGVIIFRYTSGAPATGRTFGAVYYRGLTASQMNMATAGRWDSQPPYADITPVITSADQAKREFIRDKGDGYYVTYWGGPYVKQ
jgi:hypothetical protein